MPTPLEILLNPIALIVIAMYAMLMIWEALFPARKLPHVRGWYVKGIVSFLVFFAISSYLPILIYTWLPVSTLFDFSRVPVIVGGLMGFLMYQIALYTWHRTMHKSDRLWKVFHQMHHSAERIDTYGAFYFSPLDMAGFTVMGLTCSLIIGLSPQAATIVILSTNFFTIFQHANIKTPIWLGYIIQRPESHAYHHAKGIHGFNYCDLPVIDMLFKTFRNPVGYVEENGFYHGASDRVKDMLLFRDINDDQPNKAA